MRKITKKVQKICIIDKKVVILRAEMKNCAKKIVK